MVTNLTEFKSIFWGSLHPVISKRLIVMFIMVSSGMQPVLAQIDTDIRIRKVNMDGNDSYAEMVLMEVVASQPSALYSRWVFWKRSGDLFSESEVRRDVVRLQRFYERRGFPMAKVVHRIEPGRKEWQRDIHFEIYEGPEIMISSVVCNIVGGGSDERSILSDAMFERTLSRIHFREGRRFEYIREDEVIGEIQTSLRNMGYAFSQTTIQSQVDSVTFQAQIVIAVDPGPLAFIDQINVDGNETVSDRNVVRESALRVGQQFDQRRLNRAQREIFSHHLFRFVTISIPEQPRDSTVTIDVRVRENPLRSVSLLAGVGTEEIVRGSVSWVHRNPFGNAHNIGVTARASFLEQRFSADYLIPFVFNTQSSIVISPFAQRIDERNYYVTRIGASNSFVYQYNQELAGTFSYEFTTNQEAFDTDTKLFRDSTETYRQSTFKLSGYYSPSFIQQEAGWAIRPYLEFSGPFNTGTLTYHRVGLDIRRFVDVNRWTQIALRSHANFILGDEEEVLPASLLNYLGGTNTVRGWGRWDLGPKRAVFEEDGRFWRYVPTGGRHMLSFNMEIRQNLNLIYRGLGIAFFLDGGQLWEGKQEINVKDLQYGAGFGFRYRSPIGPVRLDFGYKLNPNDTDMAIYDGVDYGGRLQRIGIHFNIGQAF
jgi:outer membrane protein insertion porin family